MEKNRKRRDARYTETHIHSDGNTRNNLSDNYLKQESGQDYCLVYDSYIHAIYRYDSDLAVLQRDIFIRDQEDCEEVIPEKWGKRPHIEKAKESFARIFYQVL